MITYTIIKYYLLFLIITFIYCALHTIIKGVAPLNLIIINGFFDNSLWIPPLILSIIRNKTPLTFKGIQ